LQTLPLGKHNPKLIELHKAIQRANLTSNGLLPIEGPNLLEEAGRSGIEILDVFVRRGVRLASIPKCAAIYDVDEPAFKTIQSTESSQGVVALVRPPIFSLDRILEAERARIVVLGRLQDPGNVGTILRVAESFFATGCLALKGTASIHSPKTVRSSTGSVFRLPHVWNLELDEVTDKLKEAQIRLIGTSPAADLTIDQIDWRRPYALFVGNEGSGLSDAELQRCDQICRIPQNPAVESMNSAIATAIILYEASKHERITF
jgi:RNA methyltransferase, TrmH family